MVFTSIVYAHLHSLYKYMDYYRYSFTNCRGIEGWVGLVGRPMADSLLTKWSPVDHRSGSGQGTSADQRPTSKGVNDIKWDVFHVSVISGLFNCLTCHLTVTLFSSPAHSNACLNVNCLTSDAVKTLTTLHNRAPLIYLRHMKIFLGDTVVAINNNER